MKSGYNLDRKVSGSATHDLISFEFFTSRKGEALCVTALDHPQLQQLNHGRLNCTVEQARGPRSSKTGDIICKFKLL